MLKSRMPTIAIDVAICSDIIFTVVLVVSSHLELGQNAAQPFLRACIEV